MRNAVQAMDRLVTQYEEGPEGELLPVTGAVWRIEQALGERDLHRRLAELVDTRRAEIVRAASIYGPLRLGAELARHVPDGVWDESTVVLGQVRLIDWLAAVEWLDRGCPEPIPAVVATALPLLRAIAALPALERQYFDQLSKGADADEREALRREIEVRGGLDVGATQSALAMGVMATAAGQTQASGSGPRYVDERLAWAIRLMPWVQSVLAGLAVPPPGVDVHGAMFTAITSLPDALTPLERADGAPPGIASLVRELRSETFDGWHLSAAEMATWVDAIELRKRADRGVLTTGDSARLRSLLGALLEGRGEGTEGATTPGELETLLRPRLRGRLERRLQMGGAWPYPADRTVGTYWRALWAVWLEFTEERPPQECVHPGCGASFPAHGNRRYCSVHQRERDRQRKRRYGPE